MRIGWGGLLLLAGCTAIFDLHSAPNEDHDNDGVIDREDNCPEAFNRDQSDKGGDQREQSQPVDNHRDGILDWSRSEQRDRIAGRMPDVPLRAPARRRQRI